MADTHDSKSCAERHGSSTLPLGIIYSKKSMKEVIQQREWEQGAKRYSFPHVRKVFIRTPAVLKMLGDIKSKNVIDLGCGDGYYSRLLAKRGAKVVGIDFSSQSINLAKNIEEKEKLGIKYFRGDIGRLLFLKSGYFDIALAEMVFTTIPTQTKYRAIVKEVKRILRPGGFLIASKGHPTAFFERNNKFYKWWFDKKDITYFDSLSPQRVEMIIAGKTIRFTNFHRTLEDFLWPWLRNGFVVTDVQEPKSSLRAVKKFPEHLLPTIKIPAFIIFKLQKQK